MKRTALILVAAAVGLGACVQRTEPPGGKGICYSVTPQKDGPPKYHVVARDQPQLEYCAARLEEVRIRFLRMGGGKRKVIGAYQSQFLWVDSGGVSLSSTLEGPRFVALRRSRDGRLAIPGAFPMDPKDMRKVPAEGGAAPAPAAPAEGASATPPQG